EAGVAGVPGGAPEPGWVVITRWTVAGAGSEPGTTRCCPTLIGASALGSLLSFTSVATETPYRFASEVSVSPGLTSTTRCGARGPAAGPAAPSAAPRATLRPRAALPTRVTARTRPSGSPT